ncbi:hypothetical protein FOYG_07994 [Fusarium oxysporum NRRL 32931]|uniref:Uncharacterized protein n=1 Tax=Fusarium oxysporum NRRL 32931 TaxID=660029 RepID=W9IB58_FUSOX|nr:hypothetical protein FOYG_07994 [Fusarium oxysporum NRRL 32931]
MTHPKESQETSVDFSFTKHYHLNHVMQLIIQMYRDTQKNIYQGPLAKVYVVKMPNGLFDIRTADGSPSFDAIIFDTGIGWGFTAKNPVSLSH